MAGRDTGRGRISSIDRLPEWCDEAVRWAFTALKERDLTQLEILDGLNERIRAAAWAEGVTDAEAIPQISKSAFNRRAMRLATIGRRLEETREIAAVLTPRLAEDDGEKLAQLLAQTIKSLAFEMLENAGDLPANGETAEMLMFAARAAKHAEEAKKISTDTKSKILKEFKVKAEEVVKAVGEKNGISQETMDEINRRLGVV